ncbi:SusC/RagA family TonB-linked outer membrane protein [Pontibacter diazotrophicus]|uniref:SusC/RagA family TonB-linked outer membrane protein n=1 Tax=Pontibacter diazotrophicus TaxID=1400979 RepID=A0A3D8LIC2_9BACT|nr:SusC/RagA family TonB-linked outer membrane protein [Pontibacter diazotrophicus]RDV17190.1 SusC/RagA family TonB-linked outer membrane protein [Pontibacter diazotrophicus]
MKYKHIRMFLCAVVAFSPVMLKAQTTSKVDIMAIIRGAEGKPLRGAVVTNLADAVNTVTDSLGTFSLLVTPNSILSVSAPGYETLSVEATPDLNEISLASDKSAQPVQVAFRKVAQKNLLGGVSAVNVPGILRENYFTNSLEDLEAYVGGFNGANIWGMDSYLVLVDGIPRDAESVLPTEIEQVTFLKGVSAVALYGSRAAKGVVYISTKRGEAQDQQINVRVNAGVFVPKSYPKYLGSAEYMTLYNEARRNDGLDDLYTGATIYNHSSGTNPYRYPNLDYYSSEYLQETYNRYDGTVEISGGNQQARYYTNVGFNSAGSLLNFGEAKNNGNERFNIRGNVDIDLNKYIYAKVDAAAIYNSGRGVNTNYWTGVASLRPHRFSPLIPVSMIEESDETSWQLVNNSNNLIDGKYLLGGTQLDQTNPFASIYAGGNNKYTSRQFQFNTGVGANLENVLKGLSFLSNFGVDYSTSYNQSFNNNYAVYEAAWNNYAGYDQISSLTKYGEDSKTGVQNISNSWYRQTIAFSGQFNYLASVNENHHISAMLIANGYQQSVSEVYHKTSNANLGLHLGYNYLDKYYVDFNGAMVHSARLPEGNRQAFSPTLALGWRISEEGFMEDLPAVDNLKLSVSGGVLHTDLNIPGYYLYQSIYTQTDGAWYSWRDGALNRTTDSRRGENPNLTFSKREEVNVTLEGSFLKRLLTFEGSLFANRITGNAVQASVLYPSYFSTGWPNSSFIPYINYNDDQRLGFDFNVNLNKRMGEIDWTLGMAATYYRTEATKRAEMYENEYQSRQGRPLDAIWGLRSDGFFMSQEEIDGSPTQAFGQVKPGDIKYFDQNGDGVIDSQDEVYLGKGGWYGDPLTLGLNLTAKWRNLTFLALGVGRFGAHAQKNNSYFWVDGEDKYSEVVRERWTEGTMNTATYPRLTTLNSDNNFRSSDFWLYSTNRFDLAKVQVSYDLPERILQNTFIHEWGVYLSGSNLLTVSPEREVLELNVGSSPQTRFYNFGVKALF